MSHSKEPLYLKAIKTILSAIFKIIAILCALVLKIAGTILIKISELLEKLTEHAKGH